MLAQAVVVSAPPVAVAEYCDERVCLLVSLPASIPPELHVQFSPISVRVTYGRASVMLGHGNYNTLRVSGFVDDVMFAQDGQEKAT